MTTDRVAEHDHCDHDDIECGVEAMQGEYAEVKRQRDMLRAAVDFVVAALALDPRLGESTRLMLDGVLRHVQGETS